jgi:predicted Zn-dependent protease
MLNSKHEIRNPKQCQMFKIRIFKTVLKILNFKISDLFRIFRQRRTSLWLAKFEFRILTIVFLSASFVGCATVYNPATQKKEFILIDSIKEVQLGRSMSEQIIKKGVPMLNDPVRQRYVNEVGLTIAQVSDRRDIMYHFAVLDSPDLNAFALPGGFIFVFRGLLEKIDKPELAAVLAHEVGHVAAKHSVKRMQAELGYEVLLGIALAGFGGQSPVLAQDLAGLSKTVFNLLELGYGRDDELLADKLAVRYTRLAGYDPQALVRVLELLDKGRGPSGRVFEVLSTHPRMQERVKKVRQEIGETTSPVV